MSRIKLVLLCVFVSLFLTFAGAAADVDYYDYYKAVKLTIGSNTANINGASVYMDQAPYIKADRTMVPLRFISEVLDASVEWQPSTRTILIQADGGPVIKVIVGSNTAYINNAAKVLDAPAEIRGGRTFVPLRFIGEALGVVVDYNSQTQMITLTEVDTSEWHEYTEPVTGITVLIPYDWTEKTASTASSLRLESPEETEFTFVYDDRAGSEIFKASKEELTSQGWKVVSENGSVMKLTKPNPHMETELYSYIISIRPVGNGYLVFYVETNSAAQEQDLAVIDKITPGSGV